MLGAETLSAMMGSQRRSAYYQALSCTLITLNYDPVFRNFLPPILHFVLAALYVRQLDKWLSPHNPYGTSLQAPCNTSESIDSTVRADLKSIGRKVQIVNTASWSIVINHGEHGNGAKFVKATFQQRKPYS